jgi:hypothetical protein
MSSSKVLHKFNDDSILKVITARELIHIPIWKGNRIIDLAHVKVIKDAILDIKSLDSGYRIINLEELNTSGKPIVQRYLIDGQHRAHILREHFHTNLCEPDFNIVVVEKDVKSETEAIEFFNQINNVKPQQWNIEPAILVQPYLKEFEKRFNTKTKMVRSGNTYRPYLSIDKIREILISKSSFLSQNPLKIKAFGDKLIEINKKLLDDAPIEIVINTKESKFYQRAMDIKFMLAVDPSFKWLCTLLAAH